MARIISEEEAFGVPAAQAPSGSFDTKLSPPEEAAFRKWKARYAPKDSGGDYDLRGAFKAGLTPAGAEAGADAGHWPDTFKKPNHPTFSNESIYAKYGNPGTWGGPNRDQYVPGQRKKRVVPEDVATRTDTLGESVKRDMSFGGQALDALSSMGRDLGKGTVAAADMFLGLPGQLVGIGADIGARTNALLSGESRRIQGLAGQSAKALVPEWMTTPLQSLMKAAGGGDPLDQSIVGQGIDRAGSWIEKTSRGLLTKEDVASLLDTGMAAGGVRFSPAIVKYGMDRVQDRMAAPERARLAAEASRKRIALAEAERAGQQIRPTGEVVNETTGVLTAEEVAKRTAARAKDVRTAFRDTDTANTLAFRAEERLRNEAAYNETQVRENLGKVAAPFERPVPGETLEGVTPKSKIFDPVIVGETSPILMDAWGKLKEGKGHDLTATEKIYLREHAQKLEKQLGEGVPDKLSRGERGSINQDLLKVLGTAAAVGGGTYLGILGYKLWKDYEQSQGSGNIAPSPEKSEEQLRKEIEDFHRRRGDDLPTGPSPREVPESTTPRPNAEGNYLAEAQDIAKRFGDVAGTGMAGLGALGVVKGKGGNWDLKAVSRLASPLRDRLSGSEQRYGVGLEYLMTAEEIAKNPAAVWSDKAVRGWLNKHAGTATDPLKDIEVPFKEGTKRWEDITDSIIGKEKVQGPKGPEDQFGIANTVVHKISAGVAENRKALESYLSHVGDYLSANVPPAKLAQYDLVRAVQETAKWDKELAKKMNDVQKAEKTVSPVLKEFPDGMYWQQLTKPGQFARESDVMGHSVRGYEPPKTSFVDRASSAGMTAAEARAAHPDWIPESGDSGHASYGVGGWDAIKSGDAKIYSLRDKEGKSHVTVEVASNPAIKAEGPVWSEFTAQRRAGGEPSFEAWIQQAHPELVQADIRQIKGKQNRAPDAKYLPYVQDFVKGGKWGKVGDLENTGLEDISRLTSFRSDTPILGIQNIIEKQGRYLTPEEIAQHFDSTDHPSGEGSIYFPRQRGSADPKLLAGIAATGGAATLGAYIDSDNPIRGAMLGALGVAGFGALAKGGTKGLDVALGAVSTRLGHVSDSLKLRARDYERTVLNMTDKALDEVSPFLKGIGKLPAAAQEQLKQALLTGDGAAISAALKGKPELVDAYRKVRNLLNDFEKSHVEMGRFKEGLTNYFPRVVTDLKGLLEGVGKTHAEGIEKILVNAEAKMVKEQQRGLTDIEQSVLIDRYLKSKDQTSFQPGYAKQRGIETVNDKLSKFYADPKESLLRYVSAAVQDQQLAKFFGRDIAKKSVGGRAYTDMDASIGNLIQRELKEGNITREQIGEVRQILKSRFEGGEKTPNSFIQEWRNLNNITLLTQLQSAATQMGDSVMTIYHHGLLPTMQALKEKLTGDARVTTKEFGLTNHIMEELGSNRITGKVLQGLFKTSGFSLVDQFAKGLNLNAGLIKNQKLAKTAAGQANLMDKYGKAFGEEFPQLVKDLQNGTKSERVKSLLFSELSDAQPISKMEMPEAYLNNPNGRILYQMKTYMLKQMDVIRRDAYDEIAKGNYVKGAKNLLAVSAALSLSNVPGDLVKDWISGRPIDLTKIDYVENLMRNFGVSKFSLDKAQKGKPLEAAADILLPPFKHYQEIGELGEKAAKYIPYVGRTIYDRELGGNEKRVLAERKQQRLKDRDAAESQDPGMKARRLERQRQAKEKAMQKARSY